MANKKLVSSLLFLLGVLSVFANAQLSNSYYSQTCPDAEAIVPNTTAYYISRNPTLAAPPLRMHFHDCFVRVRGCDCSVLLNNTKNNQAEKAAIPNLSLRRFDVIDAVKTALEKRCPGVVSCADVLALVARDAVFQISGLHWDVPTGQRDGRVSNNFEALQNLPPPFANINQLIASFGSKGLSVKDLVILSGAHTIGISHCPSFSNRLYTFTGKGDTDPSLDPSYIVELKKKCKPGDVTSVVEMDPGSSLKFDEHYFTIVAKIKGLFQSDAALLNNTQTRTYLKHQALTHAVTFYSDFAASMVKMGKIGVLTGKAGEIRKQCAFVN